MCWTVCTIFMVAVFLERCFPGWKAPPILNEHRVRGLLEHELLSDKIQHESLDSRVSDVQTELSLSEFTGYQPLLPYSAASSRHPRRSTVQYKSPPAFITVSSTENIAHTLGSELDLSIDRRKTRDQIHAASSREISLGSTRFFADKAYWSKEYVSRYLLRHLTRISPRLRFSVGLALRPGIAVIRDGDGETYIVKVTSLVSTCAVDDKLHRSSECPRYLGDAPYYWLAYLPLSARRVVIVWLLLVVFVRTEEELDEVMREPYHLLVYERLVATIRKAPSELDGEVPSATSNKGNRTESNPKDLAVPNDPEAGTKTTSNAVDLP
ncbi:hypothetical protein NEOLEDRAFT_1245394 [Neolentinus lepideus HHB14362 ss-1]|uniref:Fungal-type protein kinase domain-containing protein n=1 Tax=Neolentinus lepideus HHB14362 ss-1 TaxID=1314782 RepID=A0A165NX48_9AGAM|nr:hypothetical protein NEOLEDRAFT_1245394 [Neolentinus lepideus HHB14362 ss-1]